MVAGQGAGGFAARIVAVAALAVAIVALVVALTRSSTPRVVSAPTATVAALQTVPNLIGMTSNQAENVVKQVGLQGLVRWELGHEPSPTHPRGVVVVQLPAPGSKVAPGSTVTIVASIGDVRPSTLPSGTP